MRSARWRPYVCPGRQRPPAASELFGGGAESGATDALRYRSAAPDFNNQVTSSTGPIFDAQASTAIPEPGTWAAAVLLAAGASAKPEFSLWL